MGVFDTFQFKKPLFCSHCGTKHESMQSKYFIDSCKCYNIGDKIERKNIGNLIIVDEYFCGNNICDKIKEDITDYSYCVNHFYIVIENGYYLGVVSNMEDARAMIERYDENDDEKECKIHYNIW
jgi:hypothetical protein